METKNKEAMVETLKRLRNNIDYNVIKDELKLIQKKLNRYIYDESFDLEKKSKLIIKYNLINNFLDLPDDLLKAFEI